MAGETAGCRGASLGLRMHVSLGIRYFQALVLWGIILAYGIFRLIKLGRNHRGGKYQLETVWRFLFQQVNHRALDGMSGVLWIILLYLEKELLRCNDGHWAIL